MEIDYFHNFPTRIMRGILAPNHLKGKYCSNGCQVLDNICIFFVFIRY
jgi:hypothetical protein